MIMEIKQIPKDVPNWQQLVLGTYPIDSSKLCYKDVCKTDLNILHDNFKAWKSTAYQQLAHRPSVDESISLFGDILD